MLTERIINRAIGDSGPLIGADRGRCVRMRYNKSTCAICLEVCRAGAISLDGAAAVDAARCTGCMLCVSACPSGCFTCADDDFTRVAGRLRRVQDSVPFPVLGCVQAGREAHARMSCLGGLSEEHLIALAAFLDKPLYLNLAACGACRNSYVVRELQKRMSVVRKAAPEACQRIVFAEKKEELPFEDAPLDRRGFFQALKAISFEQVAGLLEDKTAEQPVPYASKRTPAKRDLLNSVVRKSSDVRAARLLRHYAFSVRPGAACNNCFACVGMCQTGALKIAKNAAGASLQFNSSLCIGCGLCRDFCLVGALELSQGYRTETYFQHVGCDSGTGSPRCKN